MAAQAPPQFVMGEVVGAFHSNAYRALAEADLICYKHRQDRFADLEVAVGTWDVETSTLIYACCLPTAQCCCQLQYLTVDPGCVHLGAHSDGTNLLLGPGVHILCNIWRRAGKVQQRVKSGVTIVHGTKVIAVVEQGYVGLASEKGEPVLLPPGMHQWDNPDISFNKMIDLSSNLISIGPYTLVTVDEGYAAITQDNGIQRVLEGGSSYMLTHQNWKFLAWLSCKMQADKVGPLVLTTGDNINLNIVAHVNWLVRDPVIAAGRNVDATANSDSLSMIRDDVILQVASALATVVGAITYGAHGTAAIQVANVRGAGANLSGVRAAVGIAPKPMDGAGRQALWDPHRLGSIVRYANSITLRYGVEVLSINLISAIPSDPRLVEIMSRGAVAAVDAEEKTKTARAQAQAAVVAAEAKAASAQATADAMLINARSVAEAKQIAAISDAESERLRAQGAKDAGRLMSQSDVAVALAKLKIAYGPFAENKSRSFFFGLHGPGDLPVSLLGNSLAAQTGITNYFSKGAGAQSVSVAPKGAEPDATALPPARSGWCAQ